MHKGAQTGEGVVAHLVSEQPHAEHAGVDDADLLLLQVWQQAACAQGIRHAWRQVQPQLTSGACTGEEPRVSADWWAGGRGARRGGRQASRAPTQLGHKHLVPAHPASVLSLRV